IQSVDEWTSWPPSKAVARNITDVGSGASSNMNSGRASGVSLGTVDPTRPPASRHEAVPTVYKSGANRLRLIGENEVVQLADVADSSGTASYAGDAISSTNAMKVQPPVHRADVSQPVAVDANTQVGLVDSPMGTFDDASVMRWLGSPHAALREKAKLELVSRGFDGTAIAIATRIFTGDVSQKLELVDALSSTTVIEPRPWLLLLLQDPDRDVRLRAVSCLGSMDDPAIAGRLQTHLVEERDPAVASRIRRVLDLR
ncbi:MAG: HEAT repeat domain-containing protein, partial [Rubripirellula sp.]